MIVVIFVFFTRPSSATTIAELPPLPPTAEPPNTTQETMSTATAAKIAKEIEEIDNTVTQALLNGDIVEQMKKLSPRIVSPFLSHDFIKLNIGRPLFLKKRNRPPKMGIVRR